MNKELSKEIAAAVLDHCYGYGAVNDDMIERTSVVVKRVLDKQAAPVEPAKQEPVAEGYMKCPACKDRGVIRQHFTELERMLIEDAFEKAVKNATLPKPVQQAEQEPDILSKSLKRIQSLERQLKTAQQQWDNSRKYALELAERLFKYEGGSPMILNAEQAEQEPLMDYERINALREGEQNGAEDAYFFVRPENDTPSLRKMFCQGFERGFHKGLKYASHVRTKDLTDDEIYPLYNEPTSDKEAIEFARAVIAADREKNR